MLKLIVFDCDGVMFDSRQANVSYYNSLLEHFGLPRMPATEEDFVHMHSVTESLRRIFSHTPRPTLEEVEVVRRQRDYRAFLGLMVIEPDLVEFLETTRHHFDLAISTNRTDTMLPLLRQYQLDHYFGKVMTAASAKRPKPAPDALLEILNHYGCRPEEAIYIGDSSVDVDHAGSCQVPLIAFKNPALPAAYHVDSFLQILHLPPLVEKLSR